MKIILSILFVITSGYSIAQEFSLVKCLATVATPPRNPTADPAIKKIWLAPESPSGEKYSAEISDLKVKVTASYFSQSENVIISAKEYGSNMTVSISGSVANINEKVSLLISVGSSTAVVNCSK